MRKLLVLLALVGGVLGGSFAKADNTHGMCTAYFNGSQNGQSHKRQSTAFEAFAKYVATHDGVNSDNDSQTDEADETATPVDVWNFCTVDANEDGIPDNNPKGIGGQPDDPNTEANDGNGKNGRGNG